MACIQYVNDKFKEFLSTNRLRENVFPGTRFSMKKGGSLDPPSAVSSLRTLDPASQPMGAA